MSIDNILAARENKKFLAAMQQKAEPASVTISNEVKFPDDAAVSVKNANELSAPQVAKLSNIITILGTVNQTVADLGDKLKEKGDDKAVLAELKSLASQVSKETKVDLSGLEIPREVFSAITSGLGQISKDIKALAKTINEQEKLELPEAASLDTSALESAVHKVENAINSLQFPVSPPTTATFKTAAGASVSAVLNADGTMPTANTPRTSGGYDKFHLVGANSDNATNIKASAGQVYAISAFNIDTTPVYLKFHNTATTPTAGTGVTESYLIPSQGTANGAGLVFSLPAGIPFSTGIGITLVTGITDASTTAIAASKVVVNIYYR